MRCVTDGPGAALQVDSTGVFQSRQHEAVLLSNTLNEAAALLQPLQRAVAALNTQWSKERGAVKRKFDILGEFLAEEPGAAAMSEDLLALCVAGLPSPAVIKFFKDYLNSQQLTRMAKVQARMYTCVQMCFMRV